MDVRALLKKLKRWTSAQPDVVGCALVGSYARNAPTAASDIDLIILTTEVEKYLLDRRWVSLFGEVEEGAVEDWGRVRTVRIFYRAGSEVEFNFTAPDWAAIPVDPGTRRVVSDGMQILFDPQEYLKAMQQAVSGKRQGKSHKKLAHP